VRGRNADGTKRRHVPREPQQGDRVGMERSNTTRGPKRAFSPIRIKGDLLFGRNAIIESLKGPRTATRLWIADGVREDERIGQLMDLARQRDVLLDTVPRHLLDDLTQGANHQGVALETEPFPYVDLEDIIENQGTILVLDHLHDPQNFGTLIRAGDAAGVAGIVLPSDRSVSVSPAVVNASAGAVEHLAVTVVANLGRAIEKIEESGRWIVGLDSGEGSVDLFDTDLPTPVALVVGSEGPGLTKNIRARCQVVVSLPMVGKVASLNAATAGSIALFDIVRRERAATA
jgi:23S rRNA (guanosine2251-2'-O)-methyltransferase